jgi:hypothetical protein
VELKLYREILKAGLGRMSKSNTKTKDLHEGKSQNLRMFYVSLDTADTVIEVAPFLATSTEASCGKFLLSLHFTSIPLSLSKNLFSVNLRKLKSKLCRPFPE